MRCFVSCSPETLRLCVLCDSILKMRIAAGFTGPIARALLTVDTQKFILKTAQDPLKSAPGRADI
jgi:hypothetical protein